MHSPDDLTTFRHTNLAISGLGSQGAISSGKEVKQIYLFKFIFLLFFSLCSVFSRQLPGGQYNAGEQLSGVALQGEKERASTASAAPADEDSKPQPEAAPAGKKPVHRRKRHTRFRKVSISQRLPISMISLSVRLKQAAKGLIFATLCMRLVMPA
ncbi:MAG: hypothetical protein MZV63_53035 [Marinilabiliales bacterium]|nr:hypothetical protein [Marinilabiliales bacterium]